MTFRVLIATRPWKRPADTIVIDVVGKGICRGNCLVRFTNKSRHIGFEIISTILSRHAARQFLSRNEMYDILYARDESGGPLHASQVLSTHLIRHRHNMAKLGLSFRPVGQNRGFEVIDLWDAERMAA